MDTVATAVHRRPSGGGQGLDRRVRAGAANRDRARAVQTRGPALLRFSLDRAADGRAAVRVSQLRTRVYHSRVGSVVAPIDRICQPVPETRLGHAYEPADP